MTRSRRRLTGGILLGAVLVSQPTLGAQAPSGCAVTLGNNRLVEASLFDGPPRDEVQLAPDRSSAGANLWTSLPGDERPVVLVCRYAGSRDPIEATLPPNTRRCVETFAKGQRIAAFRCMP